MGSKEVRKKRDKQKPDQEIEIRQKTEEEINAIKMCSDQNDMDKNLQLIC